MSYTNPSGAEPMPVMAATDKLIPPCLGGLGTRLLSACPSQDTCL